MKVLFAVSNEEISKSIVNKYQKEYKQIITYKNVYYFNAILKEIQKDKTYDRIVISEDLESFSNTQYDQIDKFIFDKLDNISDEASNIKGNDIPIILICSDRRTKSEPILVKLFSIGIYNAIIGNDRSIEEVCRLIKRPRLKKEGKTYYKIDAEDANYQAENENDVSELEIQNILAYYKKLGKDEKRYVESFDNIAAQYNDTQLRIIIKFLPLNVKAVLEEKSPKYQTVMSFNNAVSDKIRKTSTTKKSKKGEEDTENSGPSEKLLGQKKNIVMSKPVVIPSSVNTEGGRKLSKPKPILTNKEILQGENLGKMAKENNINKTKEEKIKIEEVQEPPKKKRGRPRKNPVPEQIQIEEDFNPIQEPKRGRGRPKKQQPPIREEENLVIPGFEDEEEEEENVLPGFDNINQTNEYDYQNHNYMQEEEDEEESILPGFEDEEEKIVPNNVYNSRPITQTYNRIEETTYKNNSSRKEYNSTVDFSRLLTPDKKIVTFVGTSKNGTSFIVNNLAELLSSMGINTAILDTTQNRNAYYIYTKNEENLRNIASACIENLQLGQAEGIRVNPNLTVYTSLPDVDDAINNVDAILETLLQNHSLILIDTDFETPFGYFKQSQETYLIQSLDILTIQPLTAFLRELKARNILEEQKLRIILNKNVSVRGITDKTIIGGMAFYNDPAMSFMTELFDRNTIKYISIPFEEEIYTKYLAEIINCEISLKGYSKTFMQILKELGNMVYPYIPQQTSKGGYKNQTTGYSNGRFSPSMNDTLNQMKRKY